MSRFSASTIDLSTFPAPAALETVDVEALILQARDAFTAQWELERAKNPALPPIDTVDLESNPVRKVLEAFAYELMRVRQRVNEAVLSCMVATATGDDLANLGLFFGVTKVEGETEESFRKRIVLAPEGFSTAGPVGAYQFHAVSADPVGIKDVAVLNPRPGQILLVVQAAAGNGVPGPDLLARVLTAVNREEVIPHTDMVSVVPVKVRTYAIDAGLFLYPGPDASLVRANAIAAVTSYAASVSRIGQDVTLSGLYGALQQPGVQRVVLRSPAGGLSVTEREAAFCTGITVTVDGRDE